MIGKQALEVFARVLTALVGVVKQCARLATAPQRHHERVQDELRAHLGLQIAFRAIEYGSGLEDQLAQIVPPELKREIENGRNGG